MQRWKLLALPVLSERRENKKAPLSAGVFERSDVDRRDQEGADRGAADGCRRAPDATRDGHRRARSNDDDAATAHI